MFRFTRTARANRFSFGDASPKRRATTFHLRSSAARGPTPLPAAPPRATPDDRIRWSGDKVTRCLPAAQCSRVRDSARQRSKTPKLVIR